MGHTYPWLDKRLCRVDRASVLMYKGSAGDTLKPTHRPISGEEEHFSCWNLPISYQGSDHQQALQRIRAIFGCSRKTCPALICSASPMHKRMITSPDSRGLGSREEPWAGRVRLSAIFDSSYLASVLRVKVLIQHPNRMSAWIASQVQNLQVSLSRTRSIRLFRRVWRVYPA
jgi:hypothetical protein